MSRYKTIGKNLAILREKRSLTQDDVAKYLGISRPMISYYETAEREIPLLHLEKLADLFSVEVADLMEEARDANQATVAFAFRTSGLQSEDLKSIAEFQKVVKNYLKMQRINGDGEK